MSKKQIILDLDDTLGDLRTPLSNTLNNHLGVDVKIDDWKTFNITDMYDISTNEFFDVIINNSLLEKIEPHEHTKNTLYMLKDRGYQLIVISSRDYHPNALGLTADWCAEHDLPIDDIHISGHNVKKSSFLKYYDNIVASLDDNIGNCVDFRFSRKIKNVLLMDMPWNRTTTKYNRIDCVSKLLDVI